MKTTMRTILDGIADTFKDSLTGTGVDTISATPVDAAVAEYLVESDSTPASTKEAATAFEAIAGHAPDTDEMIQLEAFLLSFGWLR